MQALDALFTPLVARVNKTLAETTPAKKLAAELEGRSFAVRVARSALALTLTVEAGELKASSEPGDEPDVLVEGPLSGLTRMAFAGGDIAALADTGITITGQADLGQKFQRLLKLARPDPEEELASLIGDAAAHQVGSALRQAADWGRRSGEILAANLREYLQEEQRDIPSGYEMGRFSRDVQTLRDDVERAEARLDRLERGRK
ncbi:MAG: SCP2 sterol-binding domain-containing protein [Woeseiaceae bacterium]|nr:SCP2 sterol-binding domain-containing protein [Woeseiaceae bacterium]